MGKRTFTLLLISLTLTRARVSTAQDLQLHYDWRHSIDPRNNPRNFPAITFKSFKALDRGSFLLKLEADLDGTQHNISKGYMELSQTLRLWNAPVYALGEFSGGLGVFDGAGGGYYIESAYMAGVAYPFAWQGGWGNVSVAYKRTNFIRPSHDPQATLYWGRSFANRWTFASTGVFWTQNRNHGDDYTASLSGKRQPFLIENELWWRALGLVSVGTEVRVSRDVYETDGRLLVYPTLGMRYLF
jgi:Domain of unknown function (DUF5020)